MRKIDKSILIIGGILLVFPFLMQCSGAKERVAIFEDVVHPDFNPSSEAKVELGRKLFFDKRLSKDNSVSCATCHLPEYAFTDRLEVSRGVEGRRTERNSPSILNAGYLKTVMFDAHLPTLEQQVIVPIQEHVEMDMHMLDLLKKLQEVEEYALAAKEIFDRDFDAWVLTRSIAAFERSLISDNSNFDKFYYQKDKNAISESAKRGWKLFSEELYCTKCHPAPHFTNFKAEDNGLYAEYGEDKGRFRIHHDTADIGMFKVPSLRNIELTFPYMHDGSLKTLSEIIDHYSEGGKGHFNQSQEIVAFEIDNNQKEDLINFLNSLTDTSYMKAYR